MHPRHSVSPSPNTISHLQSKTRIPQPHTRQYTFFLYDILCICFKCDVTEVLCILQIFVCIYGVKCLAEHNVRAQTRISTHYATLCTFPTWRPIYITPYILHTYCKLHAYNENFPILRCTLCIPNMTPYIYNTLYFAYILQTHAYNENLHILRCIPYISNMMPYICNTLYV